MNIKKYLSCHHPVMYLKPCFLGPSVPLITLHSLHYIHCTVTSRKKGVHDPHLPFPSLSQPWKSAKTVFLDKSSSTFPVESQLLATFGRVSS